MTDAMPGRRDRTNIVLLVLDAVRADAVEGYGAPAGASPTLASLARSGVAIPEVRSTASWTLPAHTAMFTSELARGLGLGQAPQQKPQGAAPVVKAQRPRLLAEVLRRHGYRTRGLSANGWAGKLCGFDTGFETFVDLSSSRQNDLGGGVRDRLKWDLEGVQARADDGCAQAAQVISQWINDGSREPFFWFLNVVDCHSPYLPPKPYAARSPLTRLRAADEAFRYLTFEAILLACLGERKVPQAALERMRALYRASLRYVDAWLAQLLDGLSSVGALEQTLIIVCSDHGENFGVGGLMGHGNSLDERLLRVPFIVAGPGTQCFDGIRSLAELPARIAHAAGVEDHPWPEGLPAGLPVAQWDPYELTPERLAELVNQWDLGPEAIRRLTTSLTCAVSDHLKLMRGASEGDEWLLDLSVDPLELAPIRGQRAMEEVAGPALAKLRAAVNHPLVQAKTEPSAPAEEVSAEETADIERRMRLMGYM